MIFEFTVSYRDPCVDSKLAPPYFTENSYSFELYSDLKIIFMSMEDKDYGLNCGGYMNNLLYLSGPVLDTSLPFGADILS